MLSFFHPQTFAQPDQIDLLQQIYALLLEIDNIIVPVCQTTTTVGDKTYYLLEEISFCDYPFIHRPAKYNAIYCIMASMRQLINFALSLDDYLVNFTNIIPGIAVANTIAEPDKVIAAHHTGVELLQPLFAKIKPLIACYLHNQLFLQLGYCASMENIFGPHLQPTMILSIPIWRELRLQGLDKNAAQLEINLTTMHNANITKLVTLTAVPPDHWRTRFM